MESAGGIAANGRFNLIADNGEAVEQLGDNTEAQIDLLLPQRDATVLLRFRASGDPSAWPTDASCRARPMCITIIAHISRPPATWTRPRTAWPSAHRDFPTSRCRRTPSTPRLADGGRRVPRLDGGLATEIANETKTRGRREPSQPLPAVKPKGPACMK